MWWSHSNICLALKILSGSNASEHRFTEKPPYPRVCFINGILGVVQQEKIGERLENINIIQQTTVLLHKDRSTYKYIYERFGIEGLHKSFLQCQNTMEWDNFDSERLVHSLYWLHEKKKCRKEIGGSFWHHWGSHLYNQNWIILKNGWNILDF